jgi:60 kDa SS-A/Ro ribonucleoprotein
MKLFEKVFFGRSNGTPQSMPQPDREQVANDAGGYVYALDPWDRLDRFLILGSEGGTYYAGERELTKANAMHLVSLIHEDGVRAVERIVEISQAGRAPKVSPAIFALAMCAGFGDEATRQLALGRGLNAVCRTGSHLLEFASYVKQFRGWGRALRGGVRAWYESAPVGELEYQVVKYQNRAGYTHRDLLRLSHPQAPEGARGALFAWIVKGSAPATDAGLPLIDAFERSKTMNGADAATCAAFVRESKLPREAIPTEWLREPAVWEALLGTMPMTALIRNLATMTRVGLLTPKAEATRTVVARLANGAWLRKARVHPIAVLAALETYRSGRGARGNTSWKPIDMIVDALEAAFYLAFETLEPSGARMLVALDVSGSMACGSVSGIPGLTPRVASAAMAMTHAKTEPDLTVMAFSDGFVKLDIGRDDRLGAVLDRTNDLPFQGTDCSLPMLYALEHRMSIDAFVIYTDNETWSGTIHADEALRRYRERTGIAAKLVVVAMTSTGFTIADPNDAGMLDVVGFDTSAPATIARFVAPGRASLG